MSDRLATFQAERRRLTGLAYRMLGSLAEAEDALQDAWLRWQAVEDGRVENPAGFLTRVVTRLCLDRLKAAKARRETYVGPWLPEPVVEDYPAESTGELAADLSVALLLALERLSPLERAAFLLHDVFDLDYPEVARALERSEAACRQLAARARANVQKERPRFPLPPGRGEAIAAAFQAALRSGDAAALTALLAKDAVLVADGGGLRRAALNPILGAEKIARFFAGLKAKGAFDAVVAAWPARINGLPGLVSREQDGTLQTMAFESDGERIVAIYVVRNPEKLRGVAPTTPAAG
jgi:RNA polymerase sigma-70 factor (ECF subfamily)